MKRCVAVGGLVLVGAAMFAGGCQSAPPVATMRDMSAPVDDLGRPMGPMPLAVGDRVGRSVYMNRQSLVARGVVKGEAVFATGTEPVNPAE